MKIKSILILGFLILSFSAVAQKTLFKKISIDSLVIITPIVDAAKRGNSNSNSFDSDLSSKISKELFEILKQELPKAKFKKVFHLETISQKDYIDITHNYLAWTSSKKAKQLVSAPPLLIQTDQKYTIQIAISGYYGPTRYNGIYTNLFIIDNELKKIIYCDRMTKAFAEITDQKIIHKLTRELIKRYLTFKPNQP